MAMKESEKEDLTRREKNFKKDILFKTERKILENLKLFFTENWVEMRKIQISKFRWTFEIWIFKFNFQKFVKNSNFECFVKNSNFESFVKNSNFGSSVKIKILKVR